MRSFTPEQMRLTDRAAMTQYGIPGFELMTRAGIACAEGALILAASRFSPVFLVLAGKGNNGGDAFIAARVLSERGYSVRLFMICAPEELSGDAAKAFESMPETLRQNVRRTFTHSEIPLDGIILDGLLGTGFSGILRSPFDSWIRTINGSGCPVAAIDVPSGLNALDGSADLCVRADLTVTMGMLKTGMCTGKGPSVCGRIVIAPIGFPAELIEAGGEGGLELFTEFDFRKLFGREPYDAYKNSRGLVGIIGGSAEYPGAPFLSASGALHAGAGLVRVLLPASAHPFAAIPPEIISERAPDSGLGFYTPDSLQNVRKLIRKANAVLFGPGIGQHEESVCILSEVLKSGKPCVIDADGLNLLAKNPELLSGSAVLTPHPGEMKRLESAYRLDSELSRRERALVLAAKTNCIVVLKGPGTVTASPDGRYSINTSGTPALGTAGSGDVLAGIITAFLANGFAPFDAARMGVFVHGRAAERLAPAGTRGITAGDLPGALTERGVFA